MGLRHTSSLEKKKNLWRAAWFIYENIAAADISKRQRFFLGGACRAWCTSTAWHVALHHVCIMCDVELSRTPTIFLHEA